MAKTKKKVSEDVEKNIKNNEGEVSEGTEFDKVKKKIKGWIEGCSSRKLLACVPVMLAGGIVIACFFYPGIDMNEVRNNGEIILIGLVLTVFCLGVVFYDEYKFKRLYKQLNDGTIVMKSTKIVKFKHYNRDWLDRKGHLMDRLRNDSGYRIITSDGINKYKSLRFPYVIGVYNVLDYVINNVVDNKNAAGREGKDYLIIKGKRYSLGDEVTVYVDSEKKRNYYMAVGL